LGGRCVNTPSFDPTQYKAGLRREWSLSADGWKRHWNIWERAAQHINERLVDLAGIRPGHRVLDVATGLGEPALTAARRVGSNGSVVATDLSPAMLVLARQEAARLGLRNVEFREMDAEEPGLPAQSFDAALCRWALMFLPHLVVALTRLRELLVPQGRFAAAVWARPEKVPFTSVPMGIITRVLQSAPPPAGAPGTFRLADEEVLRRAFTHAGFAEVAIERQTLTLEYSSIDEFIEERRATSASIRSMLADASPAQLETIWQIVAEEIGKYRQPSGVLRIPNETLCVVGKA
jgi:enediyne biosynthesis protein CalE5